jgi:hypothetical protein
MLVGCGPPCLYDSLAQKKPAVQLDGGLGEIQSVKEEQPRGTVVLQGGVSSLSAR